MNIASLFISLGFKIQGSKEFDAVERNLRSAAGTATKLTIGVNAVNWAMLAMVETANKAAVGLRLFEQTTGMGAGGLQRWSQAAQIAGLGSDKLKSAVMSLLDAQVAFAFNEPEAVGAWSMLGVMPTEDPITVIEKLRTRMASLKNPNLMRGLLGKVGMEGIMPLLQLPEEEFADLKKEHIISPQQIDQLFKLNKEFNKLRIALAAVKNQLSAALAPTLAIVAKALKWVAEQLAVFTTWLNSGSTAANIASGVLGVLATVMLALGAALAALTVVMGAVTLATSALGTAMTAVLPAFGAMLVTGGLLLILIGALVLIVDDLWTEMQGGESISGPFADWLISFDLVYKAIEGIWWIWDKLMAGFRAGGKFFGWQFGKMMATDLIQPGLNRQNMGESWFTPRAQSVNPALNQQNTVNVMVDGARSPEATAHEVGKSVGSAILDAAAQAPARCI